MEKNKIHGNISGIRNTILEAMESLYDIKVQGFADIELLDLMAEYCGKISREISVYIARDGRVVNVSVGEIDKVEMPSVRLVRNLDRLCGVRCIHTHPSGDPRLSSVDLATLHTAKLDAMASLGVVDGKPSLMFVAFIGENTDDEPHSSLIFGPLRPSRLPNKLLMNEIIFADNRLKFSTVENEATRVERAVLAGMDNDKTLDYDPIEELKSLAQTAGAEVVGRFVQKAKQVDKATYLGSGKTEELSHFVREKNADVIIFDDELSAIQIRNIEQATGAKVIDRTALILDIFAARASSREGKLQVELAQQKYRLPRLLGFGTSMSRLGGGIGTRGPGEKKLEVDKRRIRRRIFELEQELEQVQKQRNLRRKKRESGKTPLVSLVGYTNAGKSTLLNALSGSEEYVADQLFATLDPVVRRITLPNGFEILLSDTVGFINKLPHELVHAFRSTLEEVNNSDLILHVVDASSDYCAKQMSVVDEVLEDLKASHIPQILVRNKLDIKAAHDEENCSAKMGVDISATKKIGLDNLLHKIEEMLFGSKSCVELSIPYNRYDVVSYIRANGVVVDESHTDDGTQVKAILNSAVAGKVKSMLGATSV
ncbi:MAG: GTPase HflX [Clostridiales bacterium]|nr:GTPase HflX [Clostridiales bacterium]